MIDITKLSRRYDIRKMSDKDALKILKLCQENTQFYKYCEAEPTEEQILSDLHVTPPGKEASDKYYIGYYENETLIAVMDFIDGYPKEDIAFIGFFMMNKAYQGRQIGSAVIREACAYLKSVGKWSVRLAIDKDNPQSTHFWKKNGFSVINEVDRNGWTLLVAEKTL